MSKRFASAQTLLIAVIASLALTGCTRTVAQKVGRFDADRTIGPTTRSVREVAAYQVRVRLEGQADYQRLKGTPLVGLTKGTRVGFRKDEAGVVYAIAGEQQYRLDMPENWQSLTWYARFKKETQFGREMDKVAEGAETVGRALGNGAVVAGVVAAEILARGPDDEDCDTEHHGERHHRHHAKR
jgi:hypothetical protein